MYRMRKRQTAEEPGLIASPCNFLLEAQVKGILEVPLKRDLKKGWPLGIIPELQVRHQESC